MFKSLATFIVLLLALGTAAAHAQMADRLFEHPRVQAVGDDPVALTREMANRLQLNEGQYLKLLPLNRTRLAELARLNHLYRADETTRVAKAAELQAQFEQECSRILTPSQLSHLQQSTNPTTTPAPTGNGLG